MVLTDYFKTNIIKGYDSEIMPAEDPRYARMAESFKIQPAIELNTRKLETVRNNTRRMQELTGTGTWVEKGEMEGTWAETGNRTYVSNATYRDRSRVYVQGNLNDERPFEPNYEGPGAGLSPNVAYMNGEEQRPRFLPKNMDQYNPLNKKYEYHHGTARTNGLSKHKAPVENFILANKPTHFAYTEQMTAAPKYIQHPLHMDPKENINPRVEGHQELQHTGTGNKQRGKYSAFAEEKASNS